MDYDQPNAIWAGITECATHTDRTDDDCETCEAEMVARGARIEQMAAEAQDRIVGLSKQGQQIPPWVVMEQRMEVLIDSLFTDHRQRCQFEGEVGRRIMVIIKQMQEQAKQPTLHVAKNGPVDLSAFRDRR